MELVRFNTSVISYFSGHASDTSTKKPKKSSTPVDLVAIQCDVCGAQFTSNTMVILSLFLYSVTTQSITKVLLLTI